MMKLKIAMNSDQFGGFSRFSPRQLHSIEWTAISRIRSSRSYAQSVKLFAIENICNPAGLRPTTQCEFLVPKELSDIL